MGKEQISPEKAKQQNEYNDYVKQVTPTYNLWVNMGKAFLVGGIILLTGLKIYPTFAKVGGAGALVPITGFAKSVAAPAIEFRGSEGNVFGCGAKIFTICGPVILYGIFTSFVLGLGYYLLGCWGFL